MKKKIPCASRPFLGGGWLACVGRVALNSHCTLYIVIVVNPKCNKSLRGTLVIGKNVKHYTWTN